MCTASHPHDCSQSRQPVQFFSITTAWPKKSDAAGVKSSTSASNGHTLMHSSQPEPMHLSGSTTAFGHSLRANLRQMSPSSSRMHSTGQTAPHAPQSMHSAGSM